MNNSKSDVQDSSQDNNIRRSAIVPQEPNEGLSEVRKAKIDRQLKHYVKRFGSLKNATPKEIAKAEKVDRGMQKIYALIERGLNHVTT